MVEWINPLDRDYENQKGPGQSVKFVEFVNESKYPSLITGNDIKLILIEDFPNTFLRDNKEFHNILEYVNHIQERMLCLLKHIVGNWLTTPEFLLCSFAQKQII